jgi:transposase
MHATQESPRRRLRPEHRSGNLDRYQHNLPEREQTTKSYGLVVHLLTPAIPRRRARGWRDIKQIIDLRLVYHRLAETRRPISATPFLLLLRLRAFTSVIADLGRTGWAWRTAAVDFGLFMTWLRHAPKEISGVDAAPAGGEVLARPGRSPIQYYAEHPEGFLSDEPADARAVGRCARRRGTSRSVQCSR